MMVTWMPAANTVLRYGNGKRFLYTCNKYYTENTTMQRILNGS